MQARTCPRPSSSGIHYGSAPAAWPRRGCWAVESDLGMDVVGTRQSSPDQHDVGGRTSAIRKWAPVAAVVLAPSGAYVAMAYITGVMDVPTDDDWAYSRIVSTLYSTGHIHLVGWNEVSLVGHL